MLKEFYRAAEVATPTQVYRLFGKLDDQNYWEIMEHEGRTWTEVFHIASNYNKEADEVFYYVGNMDASPVAPSYDEARLGIQRARYFHRSMTPIENLMIDILFGVD